jgi:hypothetical protein
VDKASYAYAETGTYLRPLAMYVNNVNANAVVVARENNKIIYAQPILLQ